tara:strand:- start:235 stop:468 length:234 start_codon:yes stop_codon:yes gene_type:complete
MKIITLTIIICSALYGNCQQPYTKNIEFNSWAECLYAGTNDTLTLYNVMGDAYINTNKVFVKFMCSEVIKPKEELGS